VKTPHYSTFAVGAAVDETPPSISLDAPSPSEEIRTSELQIRASFEDSGIGVDPAETVVSVDGTELNLSTASTLTNSSVNISHPVESGNHTIFVRAVDRYGNTQTKTWNITTAEPTFAGGGGGGGGGTGPNTEEKSLSVDIYQFGDTSTIRLTNVPWGPNIDTEGAVSGEPFTVSQIQFGFQSSPEDFRIETTNPKTELAGVSEVPESTGTVLGYVGLDVIGIETEKISETQMSVIVHKKSLSAGTTLADLTAYQYVDGEWKALETSTTDGNLTVTYDDAGGEYFAVVEQPGDAEDEASKNNTDTESSSETQNTTSTSSESSGNGTTEQDDSGVEVPGFGVTAMVIALLTVAGVFRRL
jgi:hypothetical protein